MMHYLAGRFVGEVDWDDTNFGLVKRGDKYVAVRLDPACSFHDKILSTTASVDDLYEILHNLLIKFIDQEIDQKFGGLAYLNTLVDYSNSKIVLPTVGKLFSVEEEITNTLAEIYKIKESDLIDLLAQSFTPNHVHQGQKLVAKLMKSKKIYDNLYLTLSKNVISKPFSTSLCAKDSPINAGLCEQSLRDVPKTLQNANSELRNIAQSRPFTPLQ